LALGIGCKNNLEYHFNGKIGEEQVYFHESFTADDILEITKTDGSKVKYYSSSGDNLKLTYVEITVGTNTTQYHSYSENPRVKELLDQAQREFDDYLANITMIQTAPLNKKP